MHPLLNTAVKAARLAAKIINRASNDLDSLTVRAKQDNDFVSEVDHAAEQVIIDTLLDPKLIAGDHLMRFDVVVASIPGHGFSGMPSDPRFGSDEAADLLRALCERLTLLAGLYGGDAAHFQWGGIRHHADDVRIQAHDLRWHDWTRFSSRQDTLMQMGGLLGGLSLVGPGLDAFAPALWYGQWVHVGKGTSFGLGAYHIDPG